MRGRIAARSPARSPARPLRPHAPGGVVGHACCPPSVCAGGEADSASETDEAAAAAAGAGGAAKSASACSNCGVRYTTPQQVADFVRGKKLAVDLSCWVSCVRAAWQPSAAPQIRARARARAFAQVARRATRPCTWLSKQDLTRPWDTRCCNATTRKG